MSQDSKAIHRRLGAQLKFVFEREYDAMSELRNVAQKSHLPNTKKKAGELLTLLCSVDGNHTFSDDELKLLGEVPAIVKSCPAFLDQYQQYVQDDVASLSGKPPEKSTDLRTKNDYHAGIQAELAALASGAYSDFFKTLCVSSGFQSGNKALVADVQSMAARSNQAAPGSVTFTMQELGTLLSFGNVVEGASNQFGAGTAKDHYKTHVVDNITELNEAEKRGLKTAFSIFNFNHHDEFTVLHRKYGGCLPEIQSLGEDVFDPLQEMASINSAKDRDAYFDRLVNNEAGLERMYETFNDARDALSSYLGKAGSNSRDLQEDHDELTLMLLDFHEKVQPHIESVLAFEKARSQSLARA